MSSAEKTTVTFPKHLSDSLSLLQDRWLMAPNMLSDYLGSYFMKGAILQALTMSFEKHTLESYKDTSSHKLELTENNDRQTLKATIRGSKQYQVYFVGNAMDALAPDLVKETIRQNPNQNHIFENYPGVGSSHVVNHLNPLFKAGYEQIKALLKNGIAPEDITLCGFSLGGGVVTEIARRLHDEGHPVNLKLYNTFSSLSAIPYALFEKFIKNKSDVKKQYGYHLPIATSIAAFAIMGTSAGTALAGLIKSIGVLTASLIAAVGYSLSLALSMVPGLELPASLLNEMFNTFAGYLDTYIDFIASTVGALTSVVGLISGAVVGAVVGAFLSLHLLFTDKPVNMPLDLAARALLNTTTGEIDAARNVQHILSLKKHGHVEIKNAKQDGIIRPAAALNTGLGLSDNPERKLPKKGFGGNFLSMWSKQGGHSDPIEDCHIDHTLTYIEPA